MKKPGKIVSGVFRVVKRVKGALVTIGYVRGRARVKNPVPSSPKVIQAGLGELARLGTDEFRRVARAGVEGEARQIGRRLSQERRSMIGPARTDIRAIRERGGIRKPQAISSEEWRSRVPSTFRHRAKRGPGIALDELAQELADRGSIKDAYGDEALDYLEKLHQTAHSKALKSSPSELRREARHVVDTKARAAARDLVQTARTQAELFLPAGTRLNPAAAIAKSFHGGIGSRVNVKFPKLGKTAYEVGKLEAVIYRPPSWSRIGPEPRIHHFKAPRPRLIGWGKNPPWMIYGGKARFTERGFIG